MFQNYSMLDSPSTSSRWQGLTNEERDGELQECLARGSWRERICVREASANGHVSVAIDPPLSAADRGTLLLDLEELLKREVDQGITVWCEPLGDKNSLRNLRGIQIK